MIWRNTYGDAIRSDGGMPPLAAHIVTARTCYTHHGIYVGDGKVVHYAGLCRGWRRGPIEQTSLQAFARGRPVSVRTHPDSRFAACEVIARARSRLGEGCYRILSNNCEHFCEWCVCGESRSRQIEIWRTRLQRALLLVRRLRTARARGRSAADTYRGGPAGSVACSR
jgi:hypothetical protein